MWPTANILLLIALGSLAAASPTSAASVPDCHGQTCNIIDEYCSNFSMGCEKCETICNATHNYDERKCSKECSVYLRYNPLRDEIHAIHAQQDIILILLVALFVFFGIRYAWKAYRWLRHKRCFTQLLKKLQPKHGHANGPAHLNGKDCGGATTISNVMAINDIERAPSQIYSVTGAEGSVLTVTTPVSTRYPAEDSTTPTTLPTEYSYDNQALAVTPVSEKPSGQKVF